MDINQNTSEGMSKKERREVRRQEARDDQAKAARGRGAKRAFTWLIVVAVLGGVGWFVWNAAQNTPGHSTGGEALAVAVTEADNIKGSSDAAITLVEYGDYQCPACASFHPIVEQLLSDADGQVRLVYRHFPLKNIHPNAETAGRAVEAAGLQGKYFEMHNIVYERQTEWSPIPRGSARNKMLDYASELGLDRDKLDQDMDSDAVKDKIESDISGGEDSGVNSTPSFFVNGKRITDFASLEDFYTKILGGLGDDAEPAPASHDDSGSMGEDL